jgi:hypothetical protein
VTRSNSHSVSVVAPNTDELPLLLLQLAPLALALAEPRSLVVVVPLRAEAGCGSSTEPWAFGRAW